MLPVGGIKEKVSVNRVNRLYIIMVHVNGLVLPVGGIKEKVRRKKQRDVWGNTGKKGREDMGRGGEEERTGNLQACCPGSMWAVCGQYVFSIEFMMLAMFVPN